MTDIFSLKRKVKERLREIYDEGESQVIANWLVASCLGIEPEELFLKEAEEPGPEVSCCVFEGLKELMQHKPIQYVTGKAYFFGLKLLVNPSVLIPRPETEELVGWVYEVCRNRENLRVADIGTGSGCILLALAGLAGKPDLVGLDISADALETARLNAARLGTKARFIPADVLDESQWNAIGPYDLIVSNPPYVRQSERLFMRPNVLGHEPPEALFVPDEDPLLFYRAIARFARRKLQPGGWVFAEINESLGEETKKAFLAEGFEDILIRKDLHGKDRMIRAGFC